MSDEIIFFSGFALENAAGTNLEQALKSEDALWYALDKYAEERGIRATQIFLTNRDRRVKAKHHKFNHTQFLFFPRKKPWKLFFYFVKHLGRVKLLQVNTFPKPWLELPLILLAKLSGVKVIDCMLNVYNFSGLGFQGKIITIYHQYFYPSLIDAVIVETSYLKKALKPVRPVFVFSFGIDVNLYKPLGKLDTDKILLLFVGRIVPYKRIEDIISVSSDPAIKDSVILWILGPKLDGNYFNYLKRELEKNGVEYRFLPYTPREKMPPIYSNASVVINMNPDEAFTRVFPEAMACGTPVIGRVGSPGAEEIIENGKNGYLVNGVEELKDVLRVLVKRKGFLNNMAEYCREFVKQNYTYEHAYLRLKGIYDGFLNAHRKET